jgi:hypothetical protein
MRPVWNVRLGAVIRLRTQNAMVNFPGRNGRRRRVLNEEVLSASTSHLALRAPLKNDSTRVVPRYSEAAGVENHAQVTDFIPRRYRSIALLIVAGGACTAVLALLHYFAIPIAAAFGSTEIAAIDLLAPGSIAAWVAAVVLLCASASCMIVFSIRRHRIGDYRGRYRIWLAAAAACLALSANSVADFHGVFAGAMSYLTGWTVLRAGAAWWLILAGLPLLWIVIRGGIDIKECRLAAALLITTACCYVAAAAAFFGAVATSSVRVDSAIAGGALLAGHWMLLAAIVSYARFVVLDAQGLIAVRPRITGKRKSKAPSESSCDVSKTASAGISSTLSAADYARRKQQIVQSPSPAASGKWVDGTRPERDHYEDGDEDEPSDGRKLSKSDRKRLRKLKMQNRAA